ncbi:MAG: glycosyltransferase family 4 protein [bacterium]
MKIALIAGGIMEIPPKKSGAIESILWNHKLSLEALGHTVVIFNDRNLRAVARQIHGGGFDFVHLHYSEYVSFFLRTLRMPFVTTCHSGYITNKKKWSIGYYSVFYDTMRCAGIITLSPYIQKLYADSGYGGFSRVLRNGVDVRNFAVREKGNGRAICLGRIDSRKRQAWLADKLRGTDVDLDFVGVIADDAFRADGHQAYIGSWTKEEVYENLSGYSSLVLLSAGEAAALVIPEALAAGLSVVVSRSAAANLDEGLPFVTILPDDVSDPGIIADAIRAQIRDNVSYRREISEYAKRHFDMGAVAADYAQIIEEFRSADRAMQTIRIPFRELPTYLLSKLAISIKNVLRTLRTTRKSPTAFPS